MASKTLSLYILMGFDSGVERHLLELLGNGDECLAIWNGTRRTSVFRLKEWWSVNADSNNVLVIDCRDDARYCLDFVFELCSSMADCQVQAVIVNGERQGFFARSAMDRRHSRLEKELRKLQVQNLVVA